jgi:hypothetical protein
MECRLYVCNPAYNFARCFKVVESLRAGVISCEAMKYMYTAASGFRLRIVCREMSTPRRAAASRPPSPLRQVATDTDNCDDTCVSSSPLPLSAAAFIPRSPSDEQLMEILALIRQEEIEESAAGRVGDITYYYDSGADESVGPTTTAAIVSWRGFAIESVVEEEEEEDDGVL